MFIRSQGGLFKGRSKIGKYLDENREKSVDELVEGHAKFYESLADLSDVEK